MVLYTESLMRELGKEIMDWHEVVMQGSGGLLGEWVANTFPKCPGHEWAWICVTI